MELLAVKLLAMFLLSGIILIFILLPLKISDFVARKGARGKLFLSCCFCFGGGVFLGMYMLHMGPETKYLLDHSPNFPKDIVYPVPEILAGAGFFLMLFTEKLITFLYKRSEEDQLPSIEVVEYKSPEAGQIENGTAGHQDMSGCVGSVSTVAGSSVVIVEKDTMEMELTEESDMTEEDMHAHHVAVTRSIVLLLALSLDCIFEGMAMGLLSDNISVWILFVAILSHEFIVSFCLGLELVKNQKSTCGVVVWGLVYAATPALGVAIGLIVYHTPAESGDVNLVSGILLGIATGVFLYCTFIGILADQLTHDTQTIKLIMILAGYLLMAGLAAIPDPASFNEQTTDEPPLTSTASLLS